ncbi:MAG: phosphoribosylanthranilate isomerase [Endomicrobium sp.]|jgi:phosphoribosylanthranilate isomerase|nr:phosphoribosylanthranilate isomerase [Endomicrobium sp.]
MAKVKICGLANYNDALDATNLGADFLGFHFIKESPKKVSEKMVSEIVSKLPPFVAAVGVFADEDLKAVSKTVKKCSLKNVQFNGNETPGFCKTVRDELGVKVFKFFRLENDESLLPLESYAGNADYFVFDASFADGETMKQNYALAAKAGNLKVPFFMSGQIKPEDIAQVLEAAVPFGIDGDSGIERLPKRKDYGKMNAFIRYAHGLK